MAQWRIFLAESNDLEPKGEITTQASGKSLQLALNRPGAFSCSVPLDTEYKDHLVPVKNCIVAMKDDEIVWSGPIWSRIISFNEDQISLSAVGWFEILTKRYLTETITHTTTNLGDIAFDLLDKANAQQDTWISEGINTNSEVRTVKYEQFQNIGEEILNLADIEAGYDISVHPSTRELNIRAWNDYEIKEDVLFGYNWGPKNVEQLTLTEDADSMANRIYVQGTNITAQADENPSQLDYNLFTEVISLTDVKDQDLLAAIANAEVAVKKNPKVIIEFIPLIDVDGSTPELFSEYEIGDKIFLNAKYKGVEIQEQAIRVFGANIEIDNNGNEKISSLQTTYQSA